MPPTPKISLLKRGRRLGLRVYQSALTSYRTLETILHRYSHPAQVSRWKVRYLTKRYLVHGVFLLLAAATALHSQVTTGADRSSLLYTLVSGEVVTEGPLDPSAYAQADAPGIGGARLAAAAAEGIDIITFDDAEVEFSNSILEGNAVVASNVPLVPEPGSDDLPPTSKAKRSTIYEIQPGDTLSTIAATFDISENTIAWANGLSSKEVLRVGDHLTILPTTGVLHTVTSGDTVLGLAQRYEAKAKDILEYNSLGEDAKLAIGQKIIVPDGYVAPVTTPRIVPRDTRLAERDADDGPTPEPAEHSAEGVVWPTVTRHISQYFRWGHTGIDIDNRSRPAVFAALPGTVEFTGWLGGYGNLIIINHGNGTQTYYAHLDKFHVNKGASVSKGDAIGKMGSTGRSSGPHLHFEYRKNGRPINPLGLF